MDLMDYRRKIIANSPHLSSASGAVASFSDGADLLLKSLIVDIDPVQSGTGDPSPSNIRPISGWDAVEVERTGRNLVPPLTPAISRGITITTDDKGVAHVNGTCTSSNAYTMSVSEYVTLRAGTYIVSGTNSLNNNYSIQVVKNVDGVISSVARDSSGNGLSFTLDEDAQIAIRVYIKANSETVTDLTLYPMIRKATDSDATYSPYNGVNVSIDLGQTVYGGTINPLTGELVVDRAMQTVTRCSSVSTALTGALYASIATSIKAKIEAISNNNISSAYKYRVNAPTDSGWFMVIPNNIFIFDNRFVDKATADTILATEQPMFVYELDTPLTYHLDPQTVRSLYGQNNIFSDTGNVALEYWAHP